MGNLPLSSEVLKEKDKAEGVFCCLSSEPCGVAGPAGIPTWNKPGKRQRQKSKSTKAAWTWLFPLLQSRFNKWDLF